MPALMKLVEGEERMVERGDGAGLAPESRQPLRIGGDADRQHAERDIAAEACIGRTIHVAHSARTKGRQDLVRTDALALREAHGERRDLTRWDRRY